MFIEGFQKWEPFLLFGKKIGKISKLLKIAKLDGLRKLEHNTLIASSFRRRYS